MSILKAKIFTLWEWYSCRGLALVANNGVSTLGFNVFFITTDQLQSLSSHSGLQSLKSMKCKGPEVMGLNPTKIEYFYLSQTEVQNRWL